VAKFYGKELGGKMYDGLEIAVTGDSRDFMEDLYQLEAYKGEKPTNRFIYSKPLVEGPHWRDKSVYDRQQDCDAVKKGHAIEVTTYDKLGGERKQEKFVLQFPSSMKLTDKQFLGSGEPADEKVIETKLIMGKVNTGLEKDGKPIKSYSSLLTWRLCDMASERAYDGDGSKKARGQKQMEALLASGADSSPS